MIGAPSAHIGKARPEWAKVQLRHGMSDLDDIRDRLSIVDVVSGYVALRKTGRNFKALCPFHTEKTPSFVVNPERQTWRCFGACATGGDAFSFIMQAEKLEFGEALRLLAEKTGVTLRQRRDGDRMDGLHRVNQEAARFYQQVLASPEGAGARDYLEQRGVDSKTAAAFQLGLSPVGRPDSSSGLKGHLLGLGFDQDVAVEAGALRRSDEGALRDFFWGRLMFPIHDRQGRVAGFGGRSMDDSDPKYINTPSTPVFNKSMTLYGLHIAAETIRAQETGVIVEGYMDAIAAHQHGFGNVVASMGTALTEQQVGQLRSLARTFILALDPDAAGQEATRRSLEASWHIFERQRIGGRQRSVGPLYQTVRLDLRIAAMPPGLDPDQLIRDDPERWKRLTAEAVPFMDFALPAFAADYDLSSPRGKAQAAEALGPLVASMANPVEQEHYFRKLASVLGVSTDALEASIGKPAPTPRRGAPARRASTRRPRDAGASAAASAAPLEASREDFLEDYVLALLLTPDLSDRVDSVEPHFFHKLENKEVFTHLLGSSTIDELGARLNEGLHDYLTYLTQLDLGPLDRRSAEIALGQCVRRLEQRYLQEVQESLLGSEDAALPPPRQLEDSISDVNRRLRELFSQQNPV